MGEILSRLCFSVAVLILLIFQGPVQAEVVVTVNKTVQSLTVEIVGAARYRWPVSSATELPLKDG